MLVILEMGEDYTDIQFSTTEESLEEHKENFLKQAREDDNVRIFNVFERLCNNKALLIIAFNFEKVVYHYAINITKEDKDDARGDC